MAAALAWLKALSIPIRACMSGGLDPLQPSVRPSRRFGGATSCRWRIFPFCELVYFMSDDDQDIRRSLARAFDRAWGNYYRSGRLTVGEDVARTELARRLVQLSKEGIRDEGRLADAGLSHLRQLSLKGGKTEA